MMSNVELNCQIRLAKRTDLAKIHQIEEVIFKGFDQFTFRRFKSLFKSPNARFFVCELGSELAGFGIGLKKKLANGKLMGRVYVIGISPNYQKKGIGQMMLKTVENWLILEGIEFINLETSAMRPHLRAFYEKNNYVFYKNLPDYYEDFDGIRLRKNKENF